MQFDNQKTRNVADVVAKILAGESAKQEPQMLGEELVGNQHKIDANKNKKIDAHDFKLLRAQKDKEKANSQKFGKGVKEEVEELDEMDKSRPSAPRGAEGLPVGTKADPVKTDKVKSDALKVLQKQYKKVKEEVEELTESHFKVGDKVRCKESGMDGKIIKLDKEDGGEDEKYYTFKREDGKVMKKAPNELSKINEEVHNKKKDLPFTSDTVKKPVRNSDGTIQSPMSRARELAQQGMKKIMNKEEAEIDEAMFPGTKEYEKKYGESPQQKLKKKGDTVPTAQGEMKKTEKGVQHSRRFSEMISAYQEQGLKYISELSVEEEASQEEYEKEVKKAKNKSVGEEKADVAKASVQAVKNEEYEIIDANEINGVRFATIEERSLTEPEMKKKEEMVKGMKKGMEGFKQRYGDRAKEVMYATATKMAKKD